MTGHRPKKRPAKRKNSGADLGTESPSSSANASKKGIGRSSLVKWQKVLWRNQPFPDNHTDPETFLQELVINASVPQRFYWKVVLDSAVVTQQLCIVVASVAVPVQLYHGSIRAHSLLAACCALLFFGYVVCAWLGGHLLGGSVARGVRQCVLLVGGVYCLSPLLHTLTRTISQDSIIALTVVLLLGHLFLHDYNFVNSVTDKLQGTVALSAAVFAAVLIASQMPSETDVFVQVLFSLEMYLLSPFMRRYIRQAANRAHVLATAAMVVAAAVLLLPLSPWLAIVFLATVVIISFMCPGLLVSIQKRKAFINGPWDEAVPHICNELVFQRPKLPQEGSAAI